MSWWEILIIVLAAGFVVGVAVTTVIRKKKGKMGCDCGCSSCPHCAACHKTPSEGEKK